MKCGGYSTVPRLAENAAASAKLTFSPSNTISYATANSRHQASTRPRSASDRRGSRATKVLDLTSMFTIEGLPGAFAGPYRAAQVAAGSRSCVIRLSAELEQIWWTAQHCARGFVIELNDVSYLVAQREVARCAKMTCRLMRAALRRCGVIPDKRRWLGLIGQDEFETLQTRAREKAEPAQRIAAEDEDRVVELPAREAPRSVPAPTAEETENGSRLIPLRRAL